MRGNDGGPGGRFARRFLSRKVTKTRRPTNNITTGYMPLVIMFELGDESKAHGHRDSMVLYRCRIVYRAAMPFQRDANGQERCDSPVNAIGFCQGRSIGACSRDKAVMLRTWLV